MGLDAVERVVRGLVVALMNGLMYFPGHRRVVEATDEVVSALDSYFQEHPTLLLGIRERLLILEGKPLYDLSIYAHRLIRAVRDRGGWGLRFHQGVTATEVRRLIELLLSGTEGSAATTNGELRQSGVRRVALEERPLAEPGAESTSGTARAVEALSGQQMSRNLYTDALAVLQNVMVQLRRGDSVSFGAASEIATGLAEAIQTTPAPLIALTAVKNYDEYTFNHSVNVCIYTSFLAELFTTSAEDLVHVAQASLLHDVGKVLIADSILYKPGKLSEKEWEVMREHPLVGAKILLEAEGVHELAVNVAYGHHLRHDHQGYPVPFGEVTLDPVTELVTVADVYEAVTAKRPYKKPVPSEVAAKILLDGAGGEFNALCVEAFLRFFGAFPVGTTVELASGARGHVLASNPVDPFRPVVRLTHGPDGHPLETGQLIDTAERDEAGTHPDTIVHSLVA